MNLPISVLPVPTIQYLLVLRWDLFDQEGQSLLDTVLGKVVEARRKEEKFIEFGLALCTNGFAITADAGIIGAGCQSLMDPLLLVRPGCLSLSEYYNQMSLPVPYSYF